jgi:hypothetical protein
MLCAGWRCGGVKVLPLLSGFSCKVYYFRRHAFCFLPLAAILGFPPWSFSAGKKKKSQVDFQRGDPVAEPGVFGLLFSAAQCGAFA